MNQLAARGAIVVSVVTLVVHTGCGVQRQLPAGCDDGDILPRRGDSWSCNRPSAGPQGEQGLPGPDGRDASPGSSGPPAVGWESWELGEIPTSSAIRRIGARTPNPPALLDVSSPTPYDV